jgi:hypothetical protein
MDEIESLTLSVGKVAGLVSPAFFDLLVVSINSGTNLLLGFGVSSGGGLFGIETGVGSGVGNGFPACLLLLKVVSRGSGTNRRFPAKSLFSTPFSSGFWTSSFLLLQAVVSTGSGANRRTLFTVVSTGVGENRLEVGGGDVSGIMVLEELIMKNLCALLNPCFCE